MHSGESQAEGGPLGFEVVWTDPALLDAEGVWLYIARDDPDAADRVRQALFAQADALSRNPYLEASFRVLGRPSESPFAA